jgi:hypothetical protein
MATCQVDFRDKQISIDNPYSNFIGLVSPHHAKSVTSERKEVENALHNPIGHPGIEG